jgi:hypothetical protein
VVPVSDPILYGVPAVLEADENSAMFTTQPVAADTPVDVVASFPAGSLVSRPSDWQSAQESQNQRFALMLPSGLGAAAITVVDYSVSMGGVDGGGASGDGSSGAG